MAATNPTITLNVRPALSLVRRILESPNGHLHAPHLLAMIADNGLLEIVPDAAGTGLRAVPSFELMRLADAAGVERVA